jgi:hypothetical protein
MGVARLLAKGWIVFCIFACANTVSRLAVAGWPLLSAIQSSVIPGFLFGAMGLLFIVGYGISSGHLPSRLVLASWMPGFNEIVLVTFLLASFLFQTMPGHIGWGLPDALQAAMGFAVPSQRALAGVLVQCDLSTALIVPAALAWLLAFIFIGSAISRLRISAGLVRLERKRRIEPLGPSGVALVTGFAAVAGIQLLYIGSLFRLLPCNVLGGVFGDLLIGAAPLMLAYLCAAALVNLLASNPEN